MSTVTDELIKALADRLPDQADRLNLETLRREIDRLSGGDIAVPNGLPAERSADDNDVAMAANWRWAMRQREDGAFDEYAGRYVVVAEERIAAVDSDYDAAISRAVAATGVPHRDLAVVYIEKPGEGWLDVR